MEFDSLLQIVVLAPCLILFFFCKYWKCNPNFVNGLRFNEPLRLLAALHCTLPFLFVFV